MRSAAGRKLGKTKARLSGCHSKRLTTVQAGAVTSSVRSSPFALPMRAKKSASPMSPRAPSKSMCAQNSGSSKSALVALFKTLQPADSLDER